MTWHEPVIILLLQLALVGEFFLFWWVRLGVEQLWGDIARREKGGKK